MQTVDQRYGLCSGGKDIKVNHLLRFELLLNGQLLHFGFCFVYITVL